LVWRTEERFLISQFQVCSAIDIGDSGLVSEFAVAILSMSLSMMCAAVQHPPPTWTIAADGEFCRQSERGAIAAGDTDCPPAGETLGRRTKIRPVDRVD
jgi:hypothetical protein